MEVEKASVNPIERTRAPEHENINPFKSTRNGHKVDSDGLSSHSRRGLRVYIRPTRRFVQAVMAIPPKYCNILIYRRTRTRGRKRARARARRRKEIAIQASPAHRIRPASSPSALVRDDLANGLTLGSSLTSLSKLLGLSGFSSSSPLLELQRVKQSSQSLRMRDPDLKCSRNSSESR